jgi:hypothetical protein
MVRPGVGHVPEYLTGLAKPHFLAAYVVSAIQQKRQPVWVAFRGEYRSRTDDLPESLRDALAS